MKGWFSGDVSSRGFIGACFGLCVLAALILVPGLGNQPLDYFDELRTAERSLSFGLADDWAAVRENGRPSFNKPPLHYWVTGAILATPIQPEVAVRLLPALGGIFVVFLTVRLGLCLGLPSPWLALAGGALLLLYGPFVEYARVGVLDTVATAFVLGGLLAMIRALKQPVYWYGVAVLAFLGALHKTPLVFLAWLFFLVAWFGFSNDRRLFGSRHLWWALVLGLLGVVAWPLLQSLRFGDAYLRDYGEFELKQMVSRDRNLGPFTYLVWTSKKWFLFSACSLGGALWLLFRRETAPAWKVTLLYALVYFAVASCLTGHSHRYLFPVLPVLALALAWTLFEMGRRFPVTVAVLLLVNTGAAGVTSFVHRGLDHRGFDPQLPLVRQMASLRSPDQPVIIWRDDGYPSYPFLLFTRFYADLEAPVLWIGPNEQKRLTDFAEGFLFAPESAELRGLEDQWDLKPLGRAGDLRLFNLRRKAAP